MRMSRDYVERNIQEIEAEGGRVLLNNEWEGVRAFRHTIVRLAMALQVDVCEILRRTKA